MFTPPPIPPRSPPQRVNKGRKPPKKREDVSSKYFASTFIERSPKAWNINKNTRPFYLVLLNGQTHASLKALQPPPPSPSLDHNKLCELGAQSYFGQGLLSLLQGQGKPTLGMWPPMEDGLPMGKRLGAFLQHMLANVLSPTLEGFCIPQEGQASTSTTKSALETPLHGTMEGRHKKYSQQPACMMLDKAKVASTSAMDLVGEGKANKMAEDPTDTSTYMRMHLGRVGSVTVLEYAHRLVCLAFHGFPLLESASHACHHGCKPGGHNGCVHPYYVKWQSQEANLSQYKQLLERQ